MVKNIPERLNKVLVQIYSWLGRERFIIYGGTAIDLLLKREVSDYDIAIESKSKKKIAEIKRILKLNGFRIIEPWREYIIQKNKKVILVYAKKKELFFDIAFIKDKGLIGLFDIESVYIEYPSLNIYDERGGLDNLKKRKLNLIRNINLENPYLILGRLIYLCSKYDIPLEYYKHRRLLLNLKNKCERYHSESKYFYKQVLPSFYAHVFKALIKAENRIAFCRILVKYKIFEKIFPPLHKSLIKLLKNKEIKKEFISIKDKKHLIYLLSTIVDISLKQDFLEEINRLKVRKWEELN